MPEPRDGAWMDLHKTFLKQAQEGNVDLLFLGDSITQGWGGAKKRGTDSTVLAKRPTSASAATGPSTCSGGSRTASSRASSPR